MPVLIGIFFQTLAVLVHGTEAHAHAGEPSVVIQGLHRDFPGEV